MADRDARSRGLDSSRDRGGLIDRRPPVGAVVQAQVTSVKPQLGLFVELPLPDKDIEGLVHVSEVSWDIQQLAKRLRGTANEREMLGSELSKKWGPGDKPWVRVLKYKSDRGKTVVDVSMLDVDQRHGGRLRSEREASPYREREVDRDVPRSRDRGLADPSRERGARPASRGPVATTEADARAARERNMSESEEFRRKHSHLGRNSRDVRLPELHSVHQAKIINAFHDGIFVKLPGYDVDGLVHHSQISRQLEMDNSLPKVERFKRIQEIVGDIDYDVWVKVVYVAKTEHLKCECSLKMVSQKNGRDLDPDHVMWLEYMRQRRAKGAGYMHPEMKSEMERVDLLLNRQPDASPTRENDSAATKSRFDAEAGGRREISSSRMDPPLRSEPHSRCDRTSDRHQSPAAERKRRYEDRSAPYVPEMAYSGAATLMSGAGRTLSPERKVARTGYDRHADQYDRSAIRRHIEDDDHYWENREDGSLNNRRGAAAAHVSPRPEAMSAVRADNTYSRGRYSDSAHDARGVAARPAEEWSRRESEQVAYVPRQEDPRAAAATGSAADILEDPAIKAKFQEVVAATVRAQLELLQAGGMPSVSGRQEDTDRSARRDTYGYNGHRER